MPISRPLLSREALPPFVFFVLVHLACVAALWTGVTPSDLALMAGLYFLRMFGITAGYHRYFSHRAFKTGRVFQFLLAFTAQSSLQSGVVWWAAKHRAHHRDSDMPEDAHSPVQHGFWFSHVGWIFNNGAQRADYSRVPDLSRYPELMWLDRNRFLPGILLGLVSWLAFGWSGLVVGFLWSTVLLYHSTFAINSVAHVLGRQRFLTGDESRNNWWLALLTMGEGWHNNHHYFMASARQGFRWWEIDLTYYLLRGLSALGIVSDLRVPPAHVLQGQRRIAEHLLDRTAQRIADKFCVDTILHKVQQRLQALEQRVSSESHNLAEIVRAELPPFDEMHRKASRVFARTSALKDVVQRARDYLQSAVTARLTAQAA